MQAINPKQVEATIQLLKAKIAMREKYLHYTQLRNLKEREVLQAALPMLDVSKTLMEQYLSAHKHQAEAMIEIEQVVVAELKSQVAIYEAMLSEGERAVVLPSGSRLT